MIREIVKMYLKKRVFQGLRVQSVVSDAIPLHEIAQLTRLITLRDRIAISS
jgi:hypothetical protein